MSEPRSILILYGSQSGNSEELAEQAGKACSNHGLNASVKAMDEIQINDLTNQKRVLIYCSTWGDGEQPDNAEDLWEAANGGAISDLKGLNFSVLALGDTSYDLFCESGKEWDAWFENMGANRVHQRVDCDVDYEGPAAEWTAAVLPLMAAIEDDLVEEGNDSSSTTVTSIAEASDVEAPKKSEKSQWNAKNPYSTKISENYVLNGEGSGKETRHIVFQLGDSGLNYKAGDALGVVPRGPPEVVQEILSITSLTGEEIVETHAGEFSLREALTDKYEVHRVSKKWIESLGPRLVSSSSSIDIKIVSRTRSSSRNGNIIMEWAGSGEDDDGTLRQGDRDWRGKLARADGGDPLAEEDVRLRAEVGRRVEAEAREEALVLPVGALEQPLVVLEHVHAPLVLFDEEDGEHRDHDRLALARRELRDE